MQTLLVTPDSHLSDDCIKKWLKTTGDILWAAPPSEEQQLGESGAIMARESGYLATETHRR